MCIVDFPLQIL